MPKWTLVVSSGEGKHTKMVLDINSCLDYLENSIDQDVKIISIQEEEDDNKDGLLNITDGDMMTIDGYDGSEVNINKGLEKNNRGDYTNTKLPEKKTLCRRVFPKSIAPSAKAANLRNATDCDVNPSEPLGYYQCFVCPLNFAYKNSLSKHLIEHSDFGSRFVCPVCDKSFPQMYRLKRHINGSADINPYNCEQCSKSFATSWNLSQHRRFSHNGMNPYKCTKCDYVTFVRSHLTRHTSFHLDERPYKCNYCSHASKSPSNLRAHERKHKDGKRYKCDICYSCFIEPQHLRDHRKTHFLKGLTVHRCKFCPSELGSPHALRNHVHRFHRDF